MIDFKILEKMLDLLNQSDAQTIEVTKRWWSTSIKVSRSPDGAGGPVTYQVASPAPQAAAPVLPAASDGAAVAPAEEPVVAGNYVEITSPMVGTFYAQPEPDADPYVQVGGQVAKGSVVCIIEAMKIMNPLESDVAGKVVERLVEDAQPVEFGQVLFRVDPNG